MANITSFPVETEDFQDLADSGNITKIQIGSTAPENKVATLRDLKDGDLKKDGSVDLDPSYAPRHTQSIATKDYVDKYAQAKNQKGLPDGYVPLDSTGFIDTSFIHAARLIPHLVPLLIPDTTTILPPVGAAAVNFHRQNATTINISVLGKATNLDFVINNRYLAKDIPKGTTLSAGDLRNIPIGETRKFPLILQNMNPDTHTAPHIIPVSNLSPVNIVHRGLYLVNAILIRIGERVWRVMAEEWTGTDHQPSVEWVLVMSTDLPNNTVLGVKDESSFTSLVWELETEIGDTTALGSESLAHKILDLENRLNASDRRVSIMEAAGVVASIPGFAIHTSVGAATADYHFTLENQGATFLMLNDNKATHVGVDIWDGASHKVDFTWVAGYDTQPWYISWTSGPKPMLWISDSGSHFDHFIDPVTGKPISFSAMEYWARNHSVITIKYNPTLSRMEMERVEHSS